MLEILLKNIGIGIVTIGTAVSSIFGITPQVVQAPNLSGTFQTPEVKALFTTSLASKITSSATSMTLVSATDKDGNTLSSSTYGFILDEGTSVEEFVLADCTGTTCTNMTRGISVTTATTSVAALQFEHRRGASVKITTAPSLVFVMNVLKGKQNLETPIRYDSTVATTTIDDDNRNLVNYELLAYTAFNGAGVIDASATQKGLVELATTLETASSAPTGSVGPLAIPASNATSTYNSATAALRVVVTKNDGKIDDNFISATTTNSRGFATSTYIGSTYAFDVGKNYFSTTTTSTWTVPNGIKKVEVEVIGGGGGGDGTASVSSGGGGAGAYCKGIVDLTGVSSVLITIGAAGAAGVSGNGGNGGDTTFATYVTASGGLGAITTAGGVGGTCSGSSVGTYNFVEIENIHGSDGLIDTSATPDFYMSGSGAGNVYGVGGQGVSSPGLPGNVAGRNGNGYGAGGSGALDSGTNNSAGAGTKGLVIIRW